MIFSDPTSPDQIFQNAKSAYDSQDYERAAKAELTGAGYQ